MKVRRLLAVLALMTALISPALIARTTFAFDPYGTNGGVKAACNSSGANAGNANTQSPVCTSKPNNGNPLVGPDGLMIKAANLLALGGGIAAVIMIMINGFRFVMSGGTPDKVSSARDGLIYAIVGLIVIVVARSIIVFVINRL
jgi:hypothetical protein